MNWRVVIDDDSPSCSPSSHPDSRQSRTGDNWINPPISFRPRCRNFILYNILIGIIHQSLRTSTITFPQVSRVPRAHPYSIESIVLSKLATTLYVLALLDTINKKMFPHVIVGLYDTYIVILLES